jgi:hypothetical protein
VTLSAASHSAVGELGIDNNSPSMDQEEGIGVASSVRNNSAVEVLLRLNH